MSREHKLNPIPEEIRRGHEQTICIMSEELAGLMWTADERWRATHQIPVANNGIELGYTIINEGDLYLHHQPTHFGSPQLQLSWHRRVQGFGLGCSDFMSDKRNKWFGIDLHIDEKTRKAMERQESRYRPRTQYEFNPDGTITKHIDTVRVRGDKRPFQRIMEGTAFIETPVESEAEYELIGGIITQMTLSVKKALDQPSENSESEGDT